MLRLVGKPQWQVVPSYARVTGARSRFLSAEIFDEIFVEIFAKILAEVAAILFVELQIKRKSKRKRKRRNLREGRKAHPHTCLPLPSF